MPMEMTKEDKDAFNAATVCHICKEKFETDLGFGGELAKAKICRDHDHLTGKFRGIIF